MSDKRLTGKYKFSMPWGFPLDSLTNLQCLGTV